MASQELDSANSRRRRDAPMTRTKKTQACVYARKGVPLERWASYLKSKKLRIEVQTLSGGMSMKQARRYEKGV